MERLIEFIKRNYKAVIAAAVCICCIGAVIVVSVIKNDSKTSSHLVSSSRTHTEEDDKTVQTQSPQIDEPENTKEEGSNVENTKEESLDNTSEKTQEHYDKVEELPKEQEENSENTQESAEEKTNAETGNENTAEPHETESKNICTISISCATINDNLNMLDESKAAFVPADGWILPPVNVAFEEGESVFDILERITKQNKIHMEFSKTPAYNSVYIEGINNLYEFDCGSLSGWEYCVNGEFPSFGCSLYEIKNGDIIEWKYTCDLGRDIGAGV